MTSFNSITCTPMLLKTFNFTDILGYCDVLNIAHSCNNDYRQIIIKGQAFFKERFVTNIQFRVDDMQGFIIRARVKAEMKKRSAYNVSCIINSSGKVIEGECECPGGVKPACCKHLFGLLAAVEDYSRREMYLAPTDRLQTWHQPTPKLVSPKKTSALFSKDQDNIKPQDNSVSYSALTQLPQTCPIFSAININPAISTDFLFYEHTVPLPAFVTTGLGNEIPEWLPVNDIIFYHQNVRKPLEELIELERSTMGQDNECWRKEREIRITASNVHTILHSKQNKNDLAYSMSQPAKDLSGILPIRLGKTREAMVKNILMHKFPRHTFRNTGLVVHPLYPFLGASPDGLLYNEKDSMIVEVKCLFNPARKSLQCLATERKDFCLQFHVEDQNWKLKKTHSYFTQIQMQLFCTNMDRCLFALFYDFRKSVHLEVIHADNQFCQEAVTVLSNFYFQNYLPIIALKD